MIEWLENPAREFERLPEKLRDRIVRCSPTMTACWLWIGPRHYKGQAGVGYGRQHWEGKNWLAHKLTYTLLIAPIPEGLVLDHLRSRGCAYRNCVRPDHLEPVTVAVNTMRGDRYAWDEQPELLAEELPF